jgi:hypothetical protein
VRAVGPGLAAFGVTGALRDPKLSIPNLRPPLNRVDNWAAGGAALALRRVEALVGAFPLEADSADAAIILPELAPGAYTIHTESAQPGEAGEVLIEVYLLP